MGRRLLTEDNAHLTTEQVIREMHGDLKVVVSVQSKQLEEAVKTNSRISKLEQWRDRILGAGTLAFFSSPFLIQDVRQWFGHILGG